MLSQLFESPCKSQQTKFCIYPNREKKRTASSKELEGTPKLPKAHCGDKWPVWVFSDVQLFVTPWTTACQAPLSMGFPRQEYWSGLSFPSSGNLLNPGTKPASPALKWILYH